MPGATPGTAAILKDSALAALVAAALGVAIVGLHIGESRNAVVLVPRFGELGVAVLLVFAGRLGIGLVRAGGARWSLPAGLAVAAVSWATGLPSAFLTVTAVGGGLVVAAWSLLALVGRTRPAAGPAGGRAALAARAQSWLIPLVIAFAVALPAFPFADRRLMDIAILVMTYVMLGWGLNIVVGLAGLLDLGYVAFYAVGAYSFALLATSLHLGFWACLPLAGGLAAAFGIALGFPVLRLRGDYLAIVTLGFGEMIRIVLTNWVSLTNGPNGISGIPRPDFFGIAFAPVARGGETTFHELFGVPYSPMQRIVFLYYLILAMALVTNLVTLRLRRLPLGRAWEALREDEIACRSLGMNTTSTKLTAFAMGAMFGGFAGSFFATRQGFISPESFVFMESALVLAIVVLGGLGSQIGVVIAAVVMIGGFEMFRNLDFLKAVFGDEFDPAQYRMIIFGLAMVLIMIWRPRGLMTRRDPTIFLKEKKAVSSDLVAQGHG